MYDTVGNVYEWVKDCWHSNYKGAPSDGSLWLGASAVIIRARLSGGGGWFNSLTHLRSANCGLNVATSWDHSLGFRIAKMLLQQRKCYLLCSSFFTSRGRAQRGCSSFWVRGALRKLHSNADKIG